MLDYIFIILSLFSYLIIRLHQSKNMFKSYLIRDADSDT